MITVKVTYTVKPEFVEKNKQNISLFMNDFKKWDSSDFRYSVYLEADGLTFLHFSTYRNEEIQKEILNVESFKTFQKERDESGLNNTHQAEILDFIDSSFNTFAT